MDDRIKTTLTFTDLGDRLGNYCAPTNIEGDKKVLYKESSMAKK